MFSRDAKDEVAGVRVQRACCASAFVRALGRFGKIRRQSRGSALIIASERASVARAVIAAAHRAGVEAHAARVPGRVGARWSATIAYPPQNVGAPIHGRPKWLANSIAINVGSRIYSRPEFITQKGANKFAPLHIAPRLPRRLCCRCSWLRAAFLTCGSVSDPSRGYHMEFFCRTDDAARSVCDAVAAFGGDAGVTRRRGRPLAYVKDATTISALLGYMGANDAVLRFEAQRVLRQTKNSIRRTVNSEAANAARAAASAARQRKAAMRAIATLGLANLAPALREAAQLRIAHPARTLRELATLAHPPITKAAMASRLRLLERLAQR